MKNLLVACRGPNWWVKLADVGISKRATEGLTALRTVAGTPDFMAPEVLLSATTQSYTNAVDIWSLGVITFLLLTGKTPFKELNRLVAYATDKLAFPSDTLVANKVSQPGCQFVRRLMQSTPEKRPRVQECQQESWVQDFEEEFESGSQEYCFPTPTSSVYKTIGRH